MKKPVQKLLVALIACVFLAVTIMLFGRVEGEEFCPQRFKVRRFSYYQIPVARIQLTPVTFSKSTRGNTPLCTHLKSNKLLGKLGSKVRWDIVYMSEIGSAANLGDADVLLKYLEQPGMAGSDSWLKWTQNKERQELVALFWPVIARMAEEDLYILMPRVFDAARAAKSPEDFAGQIRSDITTSVQQLADAERFRQNVPRADRLAKFATEIVALQAPPKSPAVEAEVDPEAIDEL